VPSELQGSGFDLPRPDPDQVRALLDQVLHSRAFQGSPRHRMLLRHLISRVLHDATAALNEHDIAVDVFGRQPSRFDGRLDSIVRVETRRLRARLRSYFSGEGRASPLFIELPVGSYVPLVAARAIEQGVPASLRRADDLVERGEHFVRQRLSQASIEQALERFDAALRESPDHVPALVGMGRAWFNLATGWYRDPRVASEHAAEALRRALAIDQKLPIAHALLGAIESAFEHDWPAARRSFERGLRHGTGQPTELAFVHSAFGCYLRYQGEVAEAEHHLALARRLDPLYINTRFHVAGLCLHQGRLQEAQAELDAIGDMAPDSMPVAGMSGLLALLRGDGAAALGHYRRACALAPDHPGCLASVAAAQGFSGDLDAADATMAELTARFGPDACSPYVLAIVATRCGRHDQAFEQLRRAVEIPDPSAVILRFDPSFAGLHADSRWPGLLQALDKPIRSS